MRLRSLWSVGLLGSLAALSVTDAAAVQCARTVTATIVAHDQPTVFNRLGAQNPNWMMYSLERDLVNKTTGVPCTAGGACSAGNVMLRPDKRTRPLALRVAEGDCLTVNFKNYLAGPGTGNNPNQGATGANPNNAIQGNLINDDQVAERTAGFHPQGLERIGSIGSDGSFVGNNPNAANCTGAAVHGSMVEPGGTCTYQYYAPHEGAYSVTNLGATMGSDQQGGTASTGLFGLVAVQPRGAKIYRGQVTEEEMRLATTGTTGTGQPIINYEAVYPNVAPWTLEGKAGLPILNTITPAGVIVHQEINAVIAGPNPDGSFPASTYPLESVSKRVPSLPNRLEPFRDFASIFHDE